MTVEVKVKLKHKNVMKNVGVVVTEGLFKVIDYAFSACKLDQFSCFWG